MEMTGAFEIFSKKTEPLYAKILATITFTNHYFHEYQEMAAPRAAFTSSKPKMKIQEQYAKNIQS